MKDELKKQMEEMERQLNDDSYNIECRDELLLEWEKLKVEINLGHDCIKFFAKFLTKNISINFNTVEDKVEMKKLVTEFVELNKKARALIDSCKKEEEE